MSTLAVVELPGSEYSALRPWTPIGEPSVQFTVAIPVLVVWLVAGTVPPPLVTVHSIVWALMSVAPFSST
jgi:hypothetical protein